MSVPPETYNNWSREDLIARLQQLEHHSPLRISHKPVAKLQKPFNFAAHPRRKIALKFSYNGAEYGGLEYQKSHTALPTVEGVLFEALAHTRLVDRHAGFEGCGWEKCGRTDRGVSAAGQVVSLWVRSALGDKEIEVQESSDGASTPPQDAKNECPAEEGSCTENADEEPGLEGDFDLMGDWDEPPSAAGRKAPPRPQAELSYVSSLNFVLPSTIRVIAWSPVSPDFSARFNCRYRHYKYFFSPRGLDVDAMRDAAERLVGEHDFRNLCKIDPTKQLTTFNRRIRSVDISPVEGEDGLYVFNLVGTAFLYNQVRHIMAVLFLVGTGMEHPSIVSALLNTDPDNPAPSAKEGEPAPPVVPSKPEYQMADPLPLMLWECGYDESDIDWRTDRNPESPPESLSQKDITGNLYHQLQSLHERSVIHTTLDAHFLKAAARHHRPPPQYFPLNHPGSQPIPRRSVMSIPLGAGAFRRAAIYVPLLERARAPTAESMNERWRVRKGARRAEKKALENGGDE